MKQSFDYQINLRGKYSRPVGKALLKLSKEYDLDIGCVLVNRVLKDVVDILILRREEERLEIMREEQELKAKMNRLKTGQIMGSNTNNKKTDD